MSNDQSNDVGVLSTLAEVDDKTFEKEDWNVIIVECESLAAKWKQLSGFIGLPSTVIDQIRLDYPNDSSSCWNESLNQWIKQNYNTEKFGKPSWKTLLGAIAYVDRHLFEKLANEHKRDLIDSVVPFINEHHSQVIINEDNVDPDLVCKEQRGTSQSHGASNIVAKPNTLSVGDHHFTFPRLDVKEMSKEKQNSLHQQLYFESVEMMEKFQTLFSAITKSLKERNISKDSILLHLKLLGSLKPVYEDPPLPVFRCQLHELRKAKDIDEVMLGIGDYCSFFNFQFIEQIVEKLGTDHDRQNLSKYRKDFNKYALRKIFECPSEVSSMNEEGLIKLYVTLDETYDNCTVSHLQLFIGKLKKILNIPSMLILHRIESGSIKLTFLLFYDQYHQLIFPLSDELIEALFQEGVIRFACEDYKFSKSSYTTEPMDGHCLQGDLLLLAYECRQANLSGWAICLHPYCAFIRQMSHHFNAYHSNHNHTCERCSNFAEMLNKHISSCTNPHCSVPMCRTTRQYQQLYLSTTTTAQFQFGGSSSAPMVETASPRPGQLPSMSSSSSRRVRTLGRSSSFSAADSPGQESSGHMSLSAMVKSKGVAPLISSLTRANLRARAEEIVNRLDREEPLLSDVESMHTTMTMQQPSSVLTQQNQQQPPLVPPNSLPAHHAHHDPMSLPSNDSTSSFSSSFYHSQMVGGNGSGGQQSMLSPITELLGNEDTSPSYLSALPLSHNNSQPQFPSFGSTGLCMGKFNGPSGQNSMATADSALVNQSLKEQAKTVFPRQKILHKLKSEYLTPGEDGFYYKIRDYNLNETDLLGSGGFGSVLWAQDLTTDKMFAIKHNKNESFKSIEDECHILSRLEHGHIIKFLGAVIDEAELPTEPPIVCKMMMELAENGNLAEMLKDEDELEAPLPQDQSLYYLQQILEGVNFLHQSGYLHLDIKTQNVLVFDGGRTVKLTDFGTAVAVGEVTSMRGLKGLTPYFTAPELIKGEVPRFSADIWGVLCILIEMLTAWPPGCHKVERNDVQMMYLIGMYEDHKINELISLNDLDVDPEVKQLFIDVLRKDPQSRPGAIELLNRPIISSAVEYGRYFDECYDSVDAEDLEASPAAECEDSLPISDVPQQILLTSFRGQISVGNEMGELPQIRDSQDNGVGGDLENSVTRIFSRQLHMPIHKDSGVSGSSQMTATSSASGHSNQQRLLYQDSGLEDRIGDKYSQLVDVPLILKSRSLPNLNFSQVSPPVSDYTVVQRSHSLGRKPNTKQSTVFPPLPQDLELTNGDYFLPERLRDLSVELSLQVTNFEQHFSWPEYGLNLHIPENSLPGGVRQCSIFIKPRIMGEYKLPEDSHLVSAVYSIKCVPKCQFSEPVTLEVQHCAKAGNTHKLSFIRAIQSNSEQKMSFFHVIETGEKSQTDDILYSGFPHHTSYGFVELSKFCQFGIIQRDTDERDYCVNVYYREESARKYGVYFTILWNTNTHKKVLDEYYQKENAVFRHDQPVEFEDTKIQLDIPFPPPKGIISDDKAWRILSLTPPVIRRKEVDNFKEGKRIPSCQLMVKCDTEQLSDLEPQSVSLKGAREPYNFFTVNVSAGSHKGKGESITVNKPSNSAHTTHPGLAEMLSELKIITDPHQLGIFLGIEPHVLKEIEKDHRQVSEQRTAVIEYWRGNCSDCSWGALADAVDKMGDYSNLVKKFRDLSKISNTLASEQACVASDSKPCIVDHQCDKLPSGSSTSIERQHNKINPEISFTVLIKELSNKVSNDWDDIGLFLGLQQEALDDMRKKYPSDAKKCFREMIKLWLRQKDSVPTWSAVIDAIEVLDYKSLAQELKDKFL